MRQDKEKESRKEGKLGRKVAPYLTLTWRLVNISLRGATLPRQPPPPPRPCHQQYFSCDHTIPFHTTTPPSQMTTKVFPHDHITLPTLPSSHITTLRYSYSHLPTRPHHQPTEPIPFPHNYDQTPSLFRNQTYHLFTQGSHNLIRVIENLANQDRSLQY